MNKGGVLKGINSDSGKRILFTDEGKEVKPYIAGSSLAGKSRQMEDRLRREIDGGNAELKKSDS